MFCADKGLSYHEKDGKYKNDANFISAKFLSSKKQIYLFIKNRLDFILKAGVFSSFRTPNSNKIIILDKYNSFRIIYGNKFRVHYLCDF